MDMSGESGGGKALKGRTVMWCAVCARWFNYDGDWDGVCPMCHITVDRLRCFRCGHEWQPTRGTLPKMCPSCKSPYWNRERMRDPLSGVWLHGLGPKCGFGARPEARVASRAKRAEDAREEDE